MNSSLSKQLIVAGLALVLFISVSGCGDRGGGYLIFPSRGPTPAENYPPVAKAEGPQSAVAGTPVVLDGSKSYDPNGDALTYTWNLDVKPAGSNAALFDGNTVHPTFTPDRRGPYTVSLVVSDGKLVSNTDTVVVTTINSSPVANAGPDQNVDVGTFVTLDGSASSDLNGDPLTYYWTMQAPGNSTAVLSDDHAVKPTFTPDVPGTYTLYLSVYDGVDFCNFWDSVVVNAGFTAVANAGPDQYHTTGPSILITLDGSGSYDTAGKPLTYSWSFTRRPVGSAATLSDPASVHPTFTADLEGKYEFSLQIFYNGYANSQPDKVTVIVVANRPVAGLPFKVIDAEYSKQLDRIIMVSGTPSNQLHIYDPVASVDQTVDLSALPTSVSVSPDGLFAAVGHNGIISYADLVSKTVVTTLQVEGNIADIVLAGNGYVYASRQQSAFVALNISTGAAAVSPNSAWGMKAKLHPSGKAIYTTISYAALKYDITSGPAVYLYSSDVYPGFSYSVGNDLWMMEDGTGLITQSGNIFTASTSTTADMVPPRATLYELVFNGGLQYATDSSTAVQIAVIPVTFLYSHTTIDDTEVWIYDDQFFTLQKLIALPHFITGGSDYPGHGKFVFYNSTGTNMFLIMQADAAAGLANDFGIVKY